MVYNRRRTTMKKTILMGIAALVVCGSVNATSWRVCSKPEAGANFLSVAAAVASNSVFAGDTLYVEPGHVETGGDLYVNKRLAIIGPGFFLTENNINVINAEEAIFANSRTCINADSTNIYGCHFTHSLEITTSYHTIEKCFFTQSPTISGTIYNITVRNCFFWGCELNSYRTVYSSLIENNIIWGAVKSQQQWNDSERWTDCVFRNNTVVLESTTPIFEKMRQCQIYNNIIINTNTGYTTTTTNQIVDTTWYSEQTIGAIDNCDIHNNVLSSSPNNSFYNCVFNATVEDVLIWDNANTIEEKYKHKADSPAVGAGVNGTTCGAYGQVNGGRAYQPAGIPQYRPYIYDANIDETPSSNNTINASFKIKVQQ